MPPDSGPGDHNDSTGTAEYQQHTDAAGSSHRSHHAGTGRFHGPNQESCTDIPFSPDHTIQHQTTDPLQQHKDRRIPTTYQRGRHRLPRRCCLATQIRGLNRESYADSQSSPRHAPSNQVTDYQGSPRTAKYQQSANMPTTSFHTVSPLASQNRDPNRKSHTDSGSRARLHRTTDYDSSTGTPEYRQLIARTTTAIAASGQVDSMNQIENRLPIPHSIWARPSSAKQPTWRQPQSRWRPTICQCDSHQTTRTTDQILNRTPIPNPVRTTPPAARSLSLIITQEPQNINTPPAHSTAAAIPTTITQPKSASQIANHWPIPNPAHDHAARHRITCNGSTMKPQNINTPPARQTSAT